MEVLGRASLLTFAPSHILSLMRMDLIFVDRSYTASELQDKWDLCSGISIRRQDSCRNFPQIQRRWQANNWDRCHYTFPDASSIQHCSVVYLRVRELQGIRYPCTRFDLTCLPHIGRAVNYTARWYSQISQYVSTILIFELVVLSGWYLFSFCSPSRILFQKSPNSWLCFHRTLQHDRPGQSKAGSEYVGGERTKNLINDLLKLYSTV